MEVYGLTSVLLSGTYLKEVLGVLNGLGAFIVITLQWVVANLFSAAISKDGLIRGRIPYYTEHAC